MHAKDWFHSSTGIVPGLPLGLKSGWAPEPVGALRTKKTASSASSGNGKPLAPFSSQ